MPNSVLLKKSSVAAKVPLTTDLAYGELALNYADGKLYFKNASNAIQAFQSGSSLASFDRKLYIISTAGTNTLAVNYAVDYVDVFVNGVKLNSTEFTATNGVSVTITALLVNDEVQLIGIKPVNVGTVSTKYNRTSYTATAGQTTFNITYSRTSTMSYVEVYVNGVFLDTSEYTATTGTSITLVTAAAVGDIVDLVGLQDFQMFDLLTTGTGLGYNNTTGTISLASSTAATANTIALRDGSGNLNANAIVGTSLTVTGAISSTLGANLATLSGNVGIGTTSPLTRLHVESPTVSYGQTAILNSSTTGEASIHIGRTNQTSEQRWTVGQGVASIGDSFGFYTGGSVKATIDTAGRVTMPFQPAFSATASGTISAVSNQVMVFPNKIITSTKAANYNTSTGAFTAPVAGTYLFGFVVWIFSTTSYVQLAYKKNGSDLIGTDTVLAMNGNPSASGSAISIAHSFVVDLAANDTMQIGVRNGGVNSGVSINWYGGHSVFYGYLVS